jgi:hypothetical protein
MFLRTTIVAFSALAIFAAGVQARGTPKPKVNDVCQADFHKFCPSEEPGRGVVIRCARAHLDQVTVDCKSAVDTANALNAARKAAKASKRASAKKGDTAGEPSAS